MKLRRLGLGLLVLAVFALAWLLARSPPRGAAVPARDAAREAAQARPAAPRAADELDARREGVPSEPAPPSSSPASEPSPPVPTRSFSAPGTIEGLVMRDGVPVPLGEAWIRRNHFLGDEGWCTHEGPEVGSERARVGDDGVFRFFVDPGDYCVGLELAGHRRARVFHVAAGQPIERWLIALGSSGLRGNVWTADGAPAADVSIWFSGAATDGNRTTGTTRTASDGSYRVAELEPGNYGLEALLGGDRSDPATQRIFSTELAPGEVKKIDFGSPRGLATWTGRLLTAAGSPLPRISSLLLLENRRAGTTIPLWSGEDALFHTPLAPGTYAVTLSTDAARIALGEFTMAEQDLETELRLSGSWANISVRYVGSKGDPRAALYMLMIHAAPRGSTGRAFTASPGYDGHWHLLDLAPGEYEVWTSRAGLARTRGETFPLSVRTGEGEVSMEITIGDP